MKTTWDARSKITVDFVEYRCNATEDEHENTWTGVFPLINGWLT